MRKRLVVGVVVLALAGCASFEEAWGRPALAARAREESNYDAESSAEFDRHVRKYGPITGPEVYRARYGQ